MTRFNRGRAVPQEGETRARKALERAVLMLQQYRRNGLTMVAIEDVLTMLGTDPATAPAVPERRDPPRDPLDDPLTGARWAGPPGSSPPLP